MWRQVVAQSPGRAAATTDVVRYDVGWKALNTMLKAGRSLSGHERNCCFYNTRGGRFANIAAAADLDFDDDGRVLATTDWDLDGDLDFWIANRTGPQIRFLRNQHDNQNQFIAFRLEGVTCNRDAIGARVELYLRDDEHPKRIKTLRAGEGYLAQCSKWLHFGLGADAKIQRAVVRWPDGTKTELHDLKPNTRYRVKQTIDRALAWNPPPRTLKLAAKKVAEPPGSDESRIVLIAPVPFPHVQYEDLKGKPQPAIKPGSGARVINLWASWCQPCLQELAEWRKHQQLLRDNGIDVLAINVDEPAEDLAAQRAKIGKLVKSMQLPFNAGFGSHELVSLFDVVQRAIVRRQKPLPLPASFLVDADGNLRIIYKGPVDTDQLIADAKLLDASPREIMDASVPYAGIWLGQPGGSSPNQIAVRLVEGGFLQQAEAYLRQLDASPVKNPMYKPVEAQVLLGALLVDQNRLEESVGAFQQALKLAPHHRQSHIELAGVLLNLQRPAEAAAHYEAALEKRPDDPELLFKAGTAHLRAGNARQALPLLESAVEVRPTALAHHQIANIHLGRREHGAAIDHLKRAYALNAKFAPSANNLAWLLATNPDDQLRDGPFAVTIAERWQAGGARADAGQLDTLAAAYAEAGRYEDAVATAKLAMQRTGDDAARRGRIEQRLKLYQQKQPYRDQ